MTSRQRFEANLGKRKGFKPPSFRLTTDGGYYFDVVQIAWENWQAAERDMLERCMAVCESRITPGTGSHAILMGAANEMKELLNEHH